MACELRLLAKLKDVRLWKKYLFAGERDDTNWLNKCLVALSPIGDKILVARGPVLVLFNLHWKKEKDDKSAPELVVHRQWDSVEELKLQDFITSAAFLPISPLDGHSDGCPDWTCIALGFSSGHLRLFTENMDLLAADQLHPEPLLHIRATTQKEANKDSSKPTEAIYAVYPSVICSLPGFNLIQTLRNSRKEVAITRARSENSAPQVTLEVKKYAFPVQPVRDACFVSNGPINQFDHLLNVSIVEGFHGNYRVSPPQHSIIASTGSCAWLQFQNTTEGITAPLEFTDVAYQVMNKLPSWLGLSSPKAKQTVIRPTEKLAPMCRLLDRRREGRAVFPSPDGSLLAVTDSLGRVTLVDVRTSTAIRIWKGYRDAECGYLEVEEELPKSRNRHRYKNHPPEIPKKVSLIVIYAPKKGIIELFPLRHGPRVAALSVGKNGRLVYTSHGLIACGSVSRKSSGPSLVSVAFLSEEGLMDISVPYHCALLDTSGRAKDLHQLMRLKSWLKEAERSEEELVTEIKTVCLKLETDYVRLQTVDYLSSVKYVTPSALISALNVFLENASDIDLTVEGTGQQRNLLTFCKQLRSLVNFYMFLKNLNDLPNEETQNETQSLTEALLLSESEVSIFIEFFKQMQLINGAKREARVTFYTSSHQSLPQFLQSLELSEKGPITAKQNLPEDDYKTLGELIFSRIILLPSQLDTWKNQAKLSNLSVEFLSRCLLSFWLQRPVANVEEDVNLFLTLLKAVVSVSDHTLSSSDNSLESPWWMEMRGVISNSSKALTALLVAVCCRSVSMRCEQEMELNWISSCKEQCNNDWENVSVDTWQWDLLITHLEDVALLNTVLSYKPPSVRKLSIENNEVSLTDLISAGEDVVSEKVAKWLVMFEIPPSLLIDKSDVEFKNPNEVFKENLEQIIPLNLQKTQKLFKGGENFVLPLVEITEGCKTESEIELLALKYLTLLKRRFPYSLTSSAILSHLAWEVMKIWQENLPNTDLLKSAIEYLKIIPSAHLRAAVCVLAWATYIKIHFESVLRLVSKVGKLPTDTLCVRELGLAREKITPFLESCSILLTTILDACAERPQTKFICRHETLWREQGTGLVVVATSRPVPSEDALLIHHQISTFFHMVTALELKDKNLFCSLLDALKLNLFGELTERPTTTIHKSGLLKTLTRFFFRIVSASVEIIHQVEGENGLISLDVEAYLKWLRMCFALASSWRIPIDELRIQHVCELYSHGFDRLAEEALQNVKNYDKLYSPLMVIVGQRINSVITASASPEKILSNLNPSLTSWLQQDLGQGLKDNRVDLKNTELLVLRILQMVPENSKADQQLVLLILENLPGLRG